MRATVSISGLYNYDPSIFDNMQYPDGVTADDVISNLTIELAELELLYPAAVTMKRAIGDWSKSRVKAWNRIAAALDAEYNPIENYDRHEDWTDGETSSGTYKNQLTGSGTNKTTDQQQNKVAGFNLTASMADHDSSSQQTQGENSQTTKSDATQTGKNDSTHSGRVHGNIGVTMAQDMIRAEIDIRTKFDMVHIIINEFKQRFCLMVY